ncbi:MAG: hypothetical protein LUM44_00785 [Pyrinomonadaceae bacterium]|nr:hypothetical protein [Pyrinomonadaceae bacterium]
MKNDSPFQRFQLIFTSFFAFTLFALTANAQFNVLATETLAEGETYLEFGSVFKPNN